MSKPNAESTNTAPEVKPDATAPGKEEAAPPPVDAGKPAEKPPEGAPPPPAEKPAPPEKYELKSRKDSPLIKSDLDEIEAEAKAQGLSQEAAQKLVDAREASHDKFMSRQQDLMRAEQERWKKEVEADPEIAGQGGKMYKENIEHAHRFLKANFDEAFVKMLSETGLGNNPGLIRGFMRAGKRMADDRAVLDGAGATPGKGRSTEEKLFPTHFKNKEK